MARERVETGDLATLVIMRFAMPLASGSRFVVLPVAVVILRFGGLWFRGLPFLFLAFAVP
jgi:hypothetical protein